MAVYLVTWDLNREKQNYAQARATLIARLRQYDHTQDPGLDSVWFLNSPGTANEVEADIRLRLDNNDRLFVTRLVQGQCAGWLATSVWEWINARL